MRYLMIFFYKRTHDTYEAYGVNGPYDNDHIGWSFNRSEIHHLFEYGCPVMQGHGNSIEVAAMIDLLSNQTK